MFPCWFCYFIFSWNSWTHSNYGFRSYLSEEIFILLYLNILFYLLETTFMEKLKFLSCLLFPSFLLIILNSWLFFLLFPPLFSLSLPYNQLVPLFFFLLLMLIFTCVTTSYFFYVFPNTCRFFFKKAIV